MLRRLRLGQHRARLDEHRHGGQTIGIHRLQRRMRIVSKITLDLGEHLKAFRRRDRPTLPAQLGLVRRVAHHFPAGRRPGRPELGRIDRTADPHVAERNLLDHRIVPAHHLSLQQQPAVRFDP